MKLMRTTTVLLGAATLIAVTPGASSASGAPTSRPPAATAPTVGTQLVATYTGRCFPEIVTGDVVRYRTGPGTGYRALGTVQRGQKAWWQDNGGRPGDIWRKVDFWGGAQDVWISDRYVRPLSPVC